MQFIAIVFAVFLCLGVGPATALNNTLIEVKLDRQKDGIPVFQRAVLSTPDHGTPDTVLLFFRGGHGIARISTVQDGRNNYALFFGPNIGRFTRAGIATATVDCPTDQWGDKTSTTNESPSCLDGYRSSMQHADDVRTIIGRLRKDFGFKRVFVMGHSKGTLSSRWLAVNLGNEIDGSIHSASMSQPDPWGNGASLLTFPYERITAPAIWLHHERDFCPTTKYSDAKKHAGDRLISVRGGEGDGHICAQHHHGYTGRGAEAVDGVINFITTGKVDAFVGTP